MEASLSADVVVIGGGIIGITTAYYLARHKFGRIILLERSNLGVGSTGRSLASIEPLSLFPNIATLQYRSIEVYKNFAEVIGGECGFTPLPLALFVGGNEVIAMRHALSIAQQAGSHVSELTPKEFLDKEPGTHLDEIASVYYSTDSGYADPILTLSSFANAARALGVIIRQNTPALAIRVYKERITGVEIPGELVSTSTIVLASGLWFGPILNKLGVTLPIQFLRHFVVVLTAPQGAPQHSILDIPFSFYGRPEKMGGKYFLGPTTSGNTFANVTDPDMDEPFVSQDMSLLVRQRLLQRFPVMAKSRIHSTFTGIADMTPDNQPLLGALPIEGLFLAAGLNGMGFKMAPGIGQVMAGLIAGDPESSLLLAPLRPMRIQEGQLLVPPRGLSLFTS